MATAVDVEGLFRKFSVAEVKDIEKKVKADIERKKEDLRQMVGRRYRDIIEAADSINQMRVSSEKILTSIRRIERSVDRLHNVQQQLVVAGQRAKMHVHLSADSAESLAKRVADLLELAYEGAVYDQCLEATWYFVTADYLYRAWKLHHAQQADSITSSFLEQQFRNVGRLRQKIANIALKTISDWSSSADTVIDAVCALAFLERASLDAALERFLQCRMAALQGVFANAESTSREQICSALSILQKTVLQIYQLFAPVDGASRTLERMRSLVASRWQPPLLREYAKRQSRQLSIASPDGIDYAKVFFMQSPAEADVNRVCESAKVWFDAALMHSDAPLSRLVHNFETIEALTVLRENIVSSLEEGSTTMEWSAACLKLFGEEVSLWHSLCVTPLENRVKELIRRDVNEGFETLTKASMADDTTGSDHVAENQDWWREQRTDTITAGTYSTLQLKARGLTMNVYRPVADLNAEIGRIDSALSTFLLGRAGEANRLFAFDDSSFHETLAGDCVDAIHKFISEMNEKAGVWRSLADSSENGDEGIVHNLITSAKLIQCFCDSAVFVRQCIMRRYSLIGDGKGTDARRDEWLVLRSSLMKCADQLYGTWVHCVLAVVRPRFDQQLLRAAGDVNFWLDHAREWEGVQIEEEAEDGRKVFSTIFVPATCSGFVSELLHDVGRCLVRVGAQSVRSDTLSILSESIRSAVARSYEKLLLNGELGQKRAIQLLFDFNVLTQMLHSTADRDETARVQRIVDRLGSFIDPFDLDVSRVHLKRNAAAVLQKWRALYRIVYTPEALRASSVPKSAASTTDAPQLLPLGVGRSRFYPLPVVAESEKLTGSGGSVISKSQQQSASVVGPAGAEEGDKGRQQTGRAHTFASTFYDKLSSSWFGGT